MSEILARPNMLFGAYPEKPLAAASWWERQETKLARAMQRRPRLPQFAATLANIDGWQVKLDTMTATLRSAFIRRLRSRLRTDGLQTGLAIQAFALVRASLQQTHGLRLHDEQLYAGWLMLHGHVVEMATGEGKTLAASLPACAAALSGTPVHVITANDYLVARDAEELRPLYEALGLTVGAVVSEHEIEDRIAAYACDVAYVSNKQIVFDYLRDRREFGTGPGTLTARLRPLLAKDPGREVRPMLRGLCFAIIDEADSVLVDDARTPLILSQQTNENHESEHAVAIGLARRLAEACDFVIDRSNRQIELTPEGVQQVEAITRGLSGKWSNVLYRDELVHQALTALHLFTADRHYVVRDEKVVLIDENTGRLMPDRSLSHGLHQMVEIKEGCEVTRQTETLARISYQQFFMRYHRLAGMSGTLVDVADELAAVYGLSVAQVPTHKPSLQIREPLQLVDTVIHKHQVLIASVKAKIADGRPVLIGTGSVAESELVSTWLRGEGFKHRVLNASQSADEATIVAAAGGSRRITVSTNMAGRGTDIPLQEGVAELGGLHVIITHLNDARRIDQQLCGRAARQGKPGSYERILCLEDEPFVRFYRPSVLRLLGLLGTRGYVRSRMLAALAVRSPQRAIEKQHQFLRAKVMRQEDRLDDLLAFAGRGT